MRVAIALLISLGLCLSASIALVYRSAPASEPLPGTGSAEPEAPPGAGADGAALSADLSSAEVLAAFHWRSVESEDLAQYRSNLLAIGCPEETVRDILAARIDALFAEREAASRFTPPEGDKPWGSRSNLTPADLARAREWRAVQLEKRDLLKELLGIDMRLDLLRATHTRNYEEFEVALGGLPSEKRDRIQLLKEEYWQESDALKERFQDGSGEEYREAYRALNQKHHQDLASALSPRELEDFLLRSSVTGNSLAAKLANFGPTEKEFRTIFRDLRQYEEETGRVGGQYGMVKVDGETRSAAREGMLERIKAVLDEDRFAEFQRFQESAYRDLVQVARHFGLHRQAVLEAYQREESFREARRRLLEDPQSSRKEETVETLTAELRQAQVALLGERPARTYWHRRSHPRSDDLFEP